MRLSHRQRQLHLGKTISLCLVDNGVPNLTVGLIDEAGDDAFAALAFAFAGL